MPDSPRTENLTLAQGNQGSERLALAQDHTANASQSQSLSRPGLPDSRAQTQRCLSFKVAINSNSVQQASLEFLCLVQDNMVSYNFMERELTD